MLNKYIYKRVAIALAISLGLTNVFIINASAKSIHQAKVISDTEFSSSKNVRGTSGKIYSNYKLNKVIGNLKNYKNITFKTNRQFVIKDKNGKRSTYNLIKSNKIKGVVLSKSIKSIQAKRTPTSNSNNSKSDDNKKHNQVNLSDYFTSDEINQINAYKSEAANINNSGADENIYTEPSQVKNTFNPGQLNPTFINTTVKWINFFRNMVGVKPLNEDDSWSADAQYGAAGLNMIAVANNYGSFLAHGFDNKFKTSFISDQDFKRASDATYSSNVNYSSYFDGATKIGSIPYSVVNDFLSDANNDDPSDGPGHREWLIGNIDKVGVGQSGDYSDYKIFDANNNFKGNQTTTPVNFPASGLFPINLIKDADWTISLPINFNNNPTVPTVTVHDNTSNKDVAVTSVNMNGTVVNTYDGGSSTSYGFGFFGTNLWFKPNSDDIKVNHSYTITVNNLPGYSSPYTYTTKLFDLGIKSNG